MLLLAQFFFSTDISSSLVVGIGVAVFLLTAGWQERRALKILVFLFIVFALGLIGVLSHEIRHVLRDIVFALFPIALLYSGYWIAGNPRSSVFFLKVVMFCGFVVAVNHLTTFFLHPELFTAELVDVREVAGRGTGGMSVVCLALIIFRKKFELEDVYMKLLPPLILFPIFLASFVLSYSRTETLVLLILILSLMGVFTRLRLSSIVAVAILTMIATTIVITTPADEVNTLRSKFSRSVEEVLSTNNFDNQSINDNWRAFETSRVMAAYFSSSEMQQLLGNGFGSLVDLGFDMNLGGEYFREIPVFHNGYAYILIKTGLLGFLCYVLFYLRVIRFSVRYANELNIKQRFWSRLLLGIVLSLILMMYVVGGMAEAHGVVLVLLIGYAYRKIGILSESTPSKLAKAIVSELDSTNKAQSESKIHTIGSGV